MKIAEPSAFNLFIPVTPEDRVRECNPNPVRELELRIVAKCTAATGSRLIAPRCSSGACDSEWSGAGEKAGPRFSATRPDCALRSSMHREPKPIGAAQKSNADEPRNLFQTTDEDQLSDLKQFIAATVSQTTAILPTKDDLQNLRKDMVHRFAIIELCKH